ncbi:hypothetical protein KJ693_01635 [bacterium]|nr:hypothetical protein [bacterium]MBU1613992.1 hypothetical protein [bacterium]
MKKNHLAQLKELSQVIQKEIQERKSVIKWLKELEKSVEKNDWLSVNFHISKKPPLIDSYVDKIDLSGFEEEAKTRFAEAKQQYNRKFLEDCKKRGFEPVTGDYSSGFTIKGLIKVHLDINKGISKIKTLAQEKTLKTISIFDILKEVTNIDKSIFSRKFDLRYSIEELYQAYCSVSRNHHEQVLLKDVMKEIWKNKQSENFWKTLDESKIQHYSLDEFSADLAQLMDGQNITKDGYRLNLSLGADGINIFDKSSNFKSYKFIKFIKGEKA